MTYIFSQVFVCLSYVFLGLTYVIKKRNLILCFSLAALLFNGLHYLLLGAWSGVGVVCIAVIRNVLFLIQNKIKTLDKYVIDDWIILIFLLIISVLTAFWTYESVWSLFSIFSTIVYTISIWQKNVKIYKFLGIVSSILNLIYCIYIRSLLGSILRFIVIIVNVVFIVIFLVNENKERKNNLEDKNTA